MNCCCICLQNSNTLTSIYSLDEQNIHPLDKLKFCELTWFDCNTLLNICAECLTSLDTSYKFKKLCSANKDKFVNLASMKCEINEETILKPEPEIESIDLTNIKTEPIMVKPEVVEINDSDDDIGAVKSYEPKAKRCNIKILYLGPDYVKKESISKQNKKIFSAFMLERPL